MTFTAPVAPAEAPIPQLEPVGGSHVTGSAERANISGGGVPEETQRRPIPAEGESKIADCWHAGMGLGETVVAVKRCCGAVITSEDVRLRFVALAEEFA